MITTARSRRLCAKPPISLDAYTYLPQASNPPTPTNLASEADTISLNADTNLPEACFLRHYEITKPSVLAGASVNAVTVSTLVVPL